MRLNWILISAVIYCNIGVFKADSDDNDDSPVCNGISKWEKGDLVVIDTDATLSDAYGINIALRASALGLAPPIVGITCVRGPFTTIADCCRNVGKLLVHLNVTGIPIYPGSNRSLAMTPPFRTSAFGNDAFGDVPFDKNLLPRIQDENAISYLVRMTRQNKGRVIFLGMGPLTNFALAQHLDEQFILNTKVLITSAGNVQGIGDFQPGIESKAFQDPEAVKFLLDECNDGRIYQLPYEAIYETNQTTSIDFWRLFYSLPATQIMSQLSQIYFRNGAPGGYVFGDPLITAAYFDPEIITRSISLREDINLSGDGRGSFRIDWLKRVVGQEANNWLCLRNVDAQAFQDFLLRLFSE